MTFDLTEILEEWPYEPGQINVRIIEGDDGEPKVQMRLDLGLLQMDVSGRPDGQRPFHCESLLEYFETRLDEFAEGRPGPGVMDDRGPASDPRGDADAGMGTPEADDDSTLGPPPRKRRRRETGDTPPSPEAGGDSKGAGAESGGGAEDPAGPDPGDIEFSLSPDDCRQLREEAVQYYHRYISLLVLGDYQGVLRDTTRNLRVLGLCREYAESEDDREVLEQFRPYLTMMRTRAVASQAIADSEPKAALWVIDEGLDALRRMYADAGQEGDFDGAGEVLLLRGMRDELMKKLPASQKSELIKRLQEAIGKENYELAAILRDELKMLKE
ncbi:MAG: UvrB/UvrC motif-containing protein [Phycisphaerales bacterium]